jgi:unsaturated rhamnogalacturonyl hydrolase
MTFARSLREKITVVCSTLIVAACLNAASCNLFAQTSPEKAAPVISGDSPATAGPKAEHLSAKLKKPDIAKAIKLVADWQLSRLPAKAEVNWTYAALYPGFMAVSDALGDPKYSKAMYKVGSDLGWQPGPRILHADDQAIGQTYLELYLQNHDARLIAPIRERMDTVMATPDDPAKPLWWWCDALFMAPPVLADLYRATGDAKYLTFMDHEWDITSHLLYDDQQHLYSRDATFLDKHEKNGQKIFWARGNGWVMAGIVRVLSRLPENSPLRAKYVLLLQQMAAAVLAVQGPDGLWKPGLLDAQDYPLSEVSGSAFIAYALAYGVDHGQLDRAIYGPAVAKAWAGLLTHVYADGRLGSIQPVGAAPGAFTETSSYVYGVGAFLLVGSELYEFSKR